MILKGRFRLPYCQRMAPATCEKLKGKGKGKLQRCTYESQEGVKKPTASQIWKTATAQ